MGIRSQHTKDMPLLKLCSLTTLLALFAICPSQQSFQPTNPRGSNLALCYLHDRFQAPCRTTSGHGSFNLPHSKGSIQAHNMSGQQLPETAQSQGYYPSQLTPSQGQYPSQQVPSQGLNTVHALTHDGVQVEINLQSGYLSWGSYSYQISSLDGFTQDGISVGIQVPKTDYNYTLTYSAPAQASNSISSNGQQPIYSQPSDRSCSVRYATPMDITPANTPHPGSYLDRDATPMDLDIATTPRAGSYQDQDTTPTAPIRSSGQDDGLVPDEESSEDGSYQDRDTTPTAPIRSSGQDDGVVSDEESSEDGPIPDISVPPVYDPMWVQNENYDPSIVWAQTAKMHFEVLFTKNVIIVSDTLVCDVTYRKGKLKQIGKVVLRVR